MGKNRPDDSGGWVGLLPCGCVTHWVAKRLMNDRRERRAFFRDCYRYGAAATPIAVGTPFPSIRCESDWHKQEDTTQ